MPRSKLWKPLLLVLVIMHAPAARADFWYKHYDQAEKAMRNGQWTEAIEQLHEALERKGDSGLKVKTYGMHFIEYFPHLKLGIAYLELGKMDAALQAFETEEVLGAIAKSDRALAELQDYRSRARRALDAAAAEEQDRIQQILSQSISTARDLAGRGLLDEAISALGQGLAVAPENAEALEVLADLRQQIAQQQREQQQKDRAEVWIAQGRDLLAAGDLAEASAAFQKAVAAQPDGEARSLLATAQRRLRAEIELAVREQDAADRATAIAAQLREAEGFESSGNHATALDRLQSVLALDPTNRPALDLQARILASQAADEQQSAQQDQIQRLLQKADADFTARRVDASLAAANRVLAIDPGNATALGYVLRVYRSISQSLLGAERQNLPPAISFADLREDRPDGSRIQQVAIADFQLNGVIIDESPVRVAYYDGESREIPGSSKSQSLGEYTLTEFTLNARLKAGDTAFRLSVTDDEGLSSASEYRVVYTPPFFRTPLFYITTLLAVVGLVTGVWWRRHLRRQRLVKRRFNPYVAGAPVLDEDLFLGRDRLVDRILQTVHNNSLLLYGERRIGKTSLQHHLKRRLQQLEDPDYEFFPVYIDLQGTPQEKFFATLAEDTFSELEPLLGGLEPATATDVDYGYRELVRDLRKIFKILKAKSSKKVKLVLLIDEVDELNEYDPKINQKLRSLFMKSFAENLVSVVSGVAIKKQWEREGSPWYNFFEEIEVTAFQRQDAEELIARPIRGIFKMEDGLVDRILTLTDCKPYLIQKLCIALVNRLHEQNRRLITVADVEAVGRPEEA